MPLITVAPKVGKRAPVGPLRPPQQPPTLDPEPEPDNQPQGAAEASRLDGRERSGRSIQDSGGDDSAGNYGDAEDEDVDAESSDEGRASVRRQAAEDAGRAKAVNGNKAETQDEQKADSAKARKQEAQISGDREDADFLKNFLPFDVGGTNLPDLSLETAGTDPGEGEKGPDAGSADLWFGVGTTAEAGRASDRKPRKAKAKAQPVTAEDTDGEIASMAAAELGRRSRQSRRKRAIIPKPRLPSVSVQREKPKVVPLWARRAPRLPGTRGPR